tara:strand:- start:999 stop:1706 length:708 start_codon:yes stop_codon:yes gene_type:complete
MTKGEENEVLNSLGSETKPENNINSELIKEFKTGDVLLFEHKANVSSWSEAMMSFLDGGISWFTQSKYSHVGIVVRDPEFTNPKLKGLFLLESNKEDIPDAENNEIKFGAEIIDLNYIIKNYNGRIYWRQLECDRGEKFTELFANAHSIIHNRPYDLIITDWISAAFGLDNRNPQRTKTFWCSALVAFIYTQLGLLSPETKWTMVTPKMFGTERQRSPMRFLNCKLKGEVIVKDL